MKRGHTRDSKRPSLYKERSIHAKKIAKAKNSHEKTFTQFSYNFCPFFNFPFFHIAKSRHDIDIFKDLESFSLRKSHSKIVVALKHETKKWKWRKSISNKSRDFYRLLEWFDVSVMPKNNIGHFNAQFIKHEIYFKKAKINVWLTFWNASLWFYKAGDSGKARLLQHTLQKKSDSSRK